MQLLEKADTTNILVTVESDKVAASRAMAQNQELLKELDTHSNDRVREMTEIQRELRMANMEIHRLRQKLSNYESEHEHCGTDPSVASFDETSAAFETASDNTDIISVISTINIGTSEEIDKLQEQLKRKMSEIAGLIEEKSRLEHLVSQLKSKIKPEIIDENELRKVLKNAPKVPVPKYLEKDMAVFLKFSTLELKIIGVWFELTPAQRKSHGDKRRRLQEANSATNPSTTVSVSVQILLLSCFFRHLIILCNNNSITAINRATPANE